MAAASRIFHRWETGWGCEDEMMMMFATNNHDDDRNTKLNWNLWTAPRSRSSKQFSSTEGSSVLRAIGKPLSGKRGKGMEFWEPHPMKLRFCKIQFLTKVPVPPLDFLPRVRVALTESVGKDVRIKVWICFCFHPRCSCHCSQSYCCGFCCFCCIFHRCPSRKMLVADVPPPEGSNIRFRWVEIMDSSWLSSTLIIMDSKRTKRLWLSLT